MTDTTAPDLTDAEFFRRMPKVELHCHLEGAVPAETFIALADRHGLTLPTRDPEHVYDFDSFVAFLERFWLVCNSMRDASDFERASYEALSHAARHWNLRYREMFWNVTNHEGVPYETQLEGLVAGLRDAETDHGILCRLIPSINRSHGPAVARQLVEDVIAHRVDEVVGIGMDDNEDNGPAERFIDAYALAGRAGLRRTAHAGETGSVKNIVDSLDLLGVDRLDHGYAMVQDGALMRRVADSGMHVTGAWFVSMFHHGADPATTPLAQMAKAGVRLSFNTDDPAMIPTDLPAEYANLQATLGLSRERIVQAVDDAVEGCWLDDAGKAALRARLRA